MKGRTEATPEPAPEPVDSDDDELDLDEIAKMQWEEIKRLKEKQQV